ncbi:MAG: hypothetical protein WDO15_08815 [Bacteroidota bacterium]
MRKYSKREIRDIASTAIYGMLARLEMSVSSKAKKIAKDGSKALARALEEEHKRQLKKFLRRSARLR